MSLPEPHGTPYRIGFVCLGNICRSPMADVVMSAKVQQAGLAELVEVDSSGTADWHVGKPMDDRAAAHLSSAGYDPTRHRAQQFGPHWSKHDLVLVMDASNLADAGVVLAGEPEVADRLRLFRSFDPEVAGPGFDGVGIDGTHAPDVPDPYYGGDEGFVAVLAMVERTCAVLVDQLASRLR